MRVDLGAIRSLRIFRNDFDFLLGLKIDEDGGAIEYGANLLRVEDMKQHHFIAAKAQWLDGEHDGFRVFVEIGDDDGDAATVQEFLEMVQRFGEIGAGVRLGAFERSKQARQLAGARRWPD